MEKHFDLISMGEAVVEIFRKDVDVPLDDIGDFVGPYPSGAPAITIDTMAKLGARSAFVATVGKDSFGNTLIKRFADDGVDTSQIIKLDEAMTGIAFTSYKSNGDRNFIFNFKTAATAYLDPSYIDIDFIMSGKWLHISANVLAFSSLTRAAVIKAVDAAFSVGIPISFDPNIRSEIMDRETILELYKPVIDKATVIIPSSGELNWMYGDDKSEKEIISDLLSGNCNFVITKEGREGCTIYSKDIELHTDAFLIDEDLIIDPTGCGDAFCAGIIYGFLQDWPQDKVAFFANAVGGLTGTRKGAMEGIRNFEEVRKFLEVNEILTF